MNKLIERLSQIHFKSIPTEIKPILDKGKVNETYKVNIDTIPYIFRLNKKDYLNSYQKEWYCIHKAKEVNVPVSEVYFVGTEDDYSYIILKYIEGVNGIDTPEDTHSEIYKTLGEYARKFNTVEVGGFGRNVKNEIEGFFENWGTFYNEKIENIFSDSLLIQKEVLTEEQAEVIKNRLSEMRTLKIIPKLCHGNLHISNTIVSPDGTVHLIDWGNGVGYLAPHADLADLIAWKDRKYLNFFLKGYGMSTEEFKKIEHDTNNILILQLLDIIKRAFVIEKKFNDENFISGSVERIMKLN